MVWIGNIRNDRPGVDEYAGTKPVIDARRASLSPSFTHFLVCIAAGTPP